MMEEELRALETYIKTVVPENSICLVQCPEQEIETYARGLENLNQSFSNRFNIVFVACPMGVKLTVIPAHSGVSLEHESQR